ncbi:MAG: arsenate reductase (glutaredoxin) [Planctomycetota bacterium]
MPAAATIYHNPRCSKSRQTLALLEARGIEPTVVRYLDEPPTPKTLDRLCKALGLEPQALARTKEARFKELGLKEGTRTRAEWLKVLSQNPVLIERPIVVVGERAAIGRPPENVLELL